MSAGTAATPSLLLPARWSADWITVPSARRDHRAAPLFRREWTLTSPVTAATLHLSGLGSANATLNAAPIDDTHLGPGLSDYSVAARATSTNVTGLLAGRTRVVLAVDLGRGFFDLHSPEVWQWSTAPWRDSVRLTAELHLTCADGSQHVLTTDQDWRTSTGGSTFDSLYEGESWDAALEPGGWREPGFDDSTWDRARVLEPTKQAGTTHQRAAREVATSGLPLRQAMADPIRVLESIEPVWTRLPDGRWVGDLGRVVAGWVRVTPLVDGPVELSVLHGEQLRPDGSVIAENGFIPTGRFQRDDLLLDGQPWEARHTWKGFRFLEVSGADVDTQVTVQARVAGADVPQTGSFVSNDPTLTWVDRAFVNTVRANLHWVPTDTPTYEKNGWTGDAQVALPAMLARFDLSRYLTSWLDDFLDAQRPDGSLPVIIPSAGWGYGHSPCSPAPEWTTLYPVLVDALVREYGLDLWPLHTEGVLAYLDHELGRLDDDGLSVGILGDYLAPGTGGPPPEDIRIESSLFLHHALQVTAAALPEHPRIAELLGAAEQLAEAINRLFLDRAAGVYSSGALNGHRASDGVGYRQTPNVLALDEGIVPAELVPGVLQHLVDDIAARDGHHHVGCLGMARLPSVLLRHGRGDVTMGLISAPSAPSWESWRLAGHQTLLEMWVDPVRSRAHYFHGAGIRFVEDDVAGLSLLEPDLRRVRIAPRDLPGVTEWTLTRRGITVRRGADELGPALWVELPTGVSAEVMLGEQTHAQVGGSARYPWSQD